MRMLIKAAIVLLACSAPVFADTVITCVDGTLFNVAGGAPPAGCTESTAFFTITSTVGVSSDDGDQLTTTMNIVRSTCNIVDATNEYFMAIFATVTIPSGAVITGATMQCFFDNASNDEPDHTVSLQYSTFTPTLTTGASDISSRQTTSSSVSWSNANLGAPGFFVSPNLATQLTEVYNITGSLNNARIGVIVRGGATATRDFSVNTRDYTTALSSRTPSLSITYSVSTSCYAQDFAIAATSQTISSASWTANGNNPSPTSYTLQYGTATDFTGTLVSSTTLNLQATVTGLSAGTQYYARVRSDPDNFYSATASTMTPSAGGGASFTEDNFNRADADLGGSTSSSGAAWVAGAGAANGDIDIVSNAAVPVAVGADTGMIYISSQTGAANYTVSANFILTTSGKAAAKLIFALSASDWIGCGWGGGGEWQCFENGTQEGSDATGDTPTSSVTMTIEVTGTNYVFKVNGNTKVSGQTIGFSHLGLTGLYLYYNESGSGESWDNVSLTLN